MIMSIVENIVIVASIDPRWSSNCSMSPLRGGRCAGDTVDICVLVEICDEDLYALETGRSCGGEFAFKGVCKVPSE